MPLLFFGDLHATDRNDLLNFKGHLKLFDHIEKTFPVKECAAIFAGDLFDKTIVNYDDVKTPLIERLLRFKECHIIEGNHDRKKGHGSILSDLATHKSIHVYREFEIRDVMGYDIVFMPFLKDDPSRMKEYEHIEASVDFGVIHAHPIGLNRGVEEIDPAMIKFKYALFYGHYHEGKDNINKPNYHTIGVPQTTRNGEQYYTKRIFYFDGKLQSITLPEFFTIKDIEYGQEIDNENCLYNILNAPSIKAVSDKYPAKNIRSTGIEIKRKEKDTSLKDQFVNKGKIDFDVIDAIQRCKAIMKKEVRPEVESRLLEVLSKVSAE